MDRRLRVLLSAYACEPQKGSEPEVGWQWARQMARFHDVTVLTRTNQEASLAAALAEVPANVRPRFVFHDLNPAWLAFKRVFRAHTLYYRRWQASARRRIPDLVRSEKLELLHHVTYAGARHPLAVGGHGVPAIWGPVGGFEPMPSAFLPWRHPRELAEELVRNANTEWQVRSGCLRRRAEGITRVIASTPESQNIFARAGIKAALHPAIGLFPIAETERTPAAGSSLQLLFVGRLLYWKGLELAIRAIAASATPATLSIIGDGPFRAAAEKLSNQLALSDRVRFLGSRPQSEVFAAYRQYDAMLYPSLHDSGSFTVLEAMANGLPVICLAYGGPGLAVTAECGVPIIPTTPDNVVESLARAIDRYAREPDLRRIHAWNARNRIFTTYDWDRKGEAMNEIYAEVTER
jgi:glycosyltransferase involved in cell wall biosynthesis